MKTWPLIGLSLALNLALAVAIVLPTKKSLSAAPARLAATPVASPTSPAPTETPPGSAAAFRWNQVVSTDLKLYRDNLRAIGCPEITVREIIRAVINENFLPPRRAILTDFQVQYWNLVMRGQFAKRQALPQTEWGQQLTALATQREQLLADVLGPEASAEAAERQAQRSELEQRRSWLLPEKRALLFALEDQYQQQLTAWTATLTARENATPTPDDEAQRQKLQQAFEDARKQLLTPQELAELDLRESPAANWATSLPGFTPTPEEWRSLTQLRSQFEADQNLPPGTDLTADEKTEFQYELQTNFDSSLQATLSPDHLAQYQLATNDLYQTLHNVIQRYGLSENLVTQGLSVQQIAQGKADQIRANANLSPEDQQAALKAIQQETQQTLSQILGPSVLSTYQEYGGDWINTLSQSN
jgi:hypothetical protein